ncbi:MAG: DUF4340 domain-containing protein [bacterium]
MEAAQIVKFNRLAVAAALLAILGAYVYYFEIRGGKEKEEKEQIEKSLFTFKKEEVTQATVEKGNGTQFTLIRNGGDWAFTGPRIMDATDSEVNYMVERLTAAQWSERVDSADLKTFGLENPRVKIILKNSAGKSQEVAFGNNTPVGLSVYLLKDGKVYTADPSAVEAGNREMDSLREKHLFLLDPDEVQGFTIEEGGRRLTLERSAVGWDMTQPIQFPADKEKVETLVRSMGFFELNRIVDEAGTDAKKYGIDPPATTLRVTAKKGGAPVEQTAYFGKVEGENWYARRANAPEVGALSARLRSDLSADPDHYRKLTILSLDRFEVNRIEGKLKDTGFSLKTDALQKWQRSKPKKGEVKWAELNDFLDTVTARKAADTVRPSSGLAPFGLDNPQVTTEFYDDKDTLLGKFIAGEKGGKYYAKADNENIVYTLAADHWNQLTTGVKKLDGEI